MRCSTCSGRGCRRAGAPGRAAPGRRGSPLVEDAGGQCELCGPGAVHEHVLVARGLLGLAHRGRHVGHVGDQRPVGSVSAPAAGEDEDRHAVVVVAAPTVGGHEGPPARDHRPGGHTSWRTWPLTRVPTGGSHLVGARPAGERPIVEALPAVAEPVARPLVRPGDEPVERHRHVEHGGGSGVSVRAHRSSLPHRPRRSPGTCTCNDRGR